MLQSQTWHQKPQNIRAACKRIIKTIPPFRLVPSGGVVIVVLSFAANYGEFSFQRTDHLSSQLFSRDTVSVKQLVRLEFREKPDLSLYGLHSFRHLFASLLVNQGVYIVTVSGALGHSTVSTTSNIYCNMLEEAQAKVSEAVSSALDFSGNRKEPGGAWPPARKTTFFEIKNKWHFRIKSKTRKRRYYAVSENVEWWPVRELKKSRAFRQLLVKCENGCISAIFEASLLASSSDFKRFSVPISGK